MKTCFGLSTERRPHGHPARNPPPHPTAAAPYRCDCALSLNGFRDEVGQLVGNIRVRMDAILRSRDIDETSGRAWLEAEQKGQ
jgi:hypothetical protein